ncbi:MAG: hypothetical protein AB8C13_10645 [Phycisphaerales bacterium]
MNTPPVVSDASSSDPAMDRYEAVFEVQGDRLVSRHTPEQSAEMLGQACWARIVELFPAVMRDEIVQFNLIPGRRWAGQFSGDGKNDLGRTGFSFSVARYVIEEQDDYDRPTRPLTARRKTLDWTLVHEMGHYICLRSNAIELFSQAFDGDMMPQPKRREEPDDYSEDGSPALDGNFVTSYAERNPGDEEVVETFTTYLLVDRLPENDSLVAQKIRFFETQPGFPELRTFVQSIGTPDRPQIKALP